MARIRFSLLWLVFWVLPSFAARDATPAWNRVNGIHFSMVTNLPRNAADSALLHFEQMRAAFGELLLKSKLQLSEPLDIIGFASHAAYAQVAPANVGSATGLFIAGEDRNYVLLDLSDDASWRRVAYPFAKVFLNYNYPPTQPWFDEGFAEYFSSLRLDTRPPQVGGDPADLTAILNAQPWIPVAKLFAMDSGASSKAGASTMFSAESWMVMHYLLTRNKLPETGTYFGLVQNQKLPVEQAIQQAYGMNPAQFDGAVKDYFHSIEPWMRGSASQASVGARATGTPSADAIQQFATLVAAGDIGTSIQRLPDAEARALVDEAALRVPERRAAAAEELETLCGSPLNETAVAHRALAWSHLQKHEYESAAEQLTAAADIDQHDLWTRYYLALAKYKQAEEGAKDYQGLPNMMQDLRAVMDLDPEFAEAYDMLALAQLQGGGVNAALTTIRIAIELNPRSQSYLLNLAHIYLAGKKWDPASALLDRLKDSSDANVASTARRNLEDLPTLKKYGILPQRSVAAQAPPPAVSSSNEESASEEEAPALPAEASPDKRKVQYLKGKIISVDCSQSPAAILRVAGGTRTLKLRAEDYKSLLLIGADGFSCDWRNTLVVVNYKAGGKADGDLVSLEIQ